MKTLSVASLIVCAITSLFTTTGCLTNPSSTTTGIDTAYTVPDFKEEVTLRLRIDGKDAPIDSAYAKIDYHFYLTGYSPRILEGGPYAYSHFVTLHAHNFKGVGNYILDDGGEGTFLWNYATNDRVKSEPATMNISKWESGNISGSFSFVVVDGFGNKKRVDGEFYR